MNNSLVQELINEDFGYRHEGSTWGRALEHTSLVVDEKNQRWYWNSEDISGDALDYLIKVRGLSPKKAKEVLAIREKIVSGVPITEHEKSYYVAYEKLVDIFWDRGRKNRDYWYARKLKDSTIDRHRLGFFDGWYTIPLYFNDVLINFQMRRDEPSKKITMRYSEKEWTPILINQSLLSIVDTIYIVEGAVDALLLTQEGIPAVAQTSGGSYWSPLWYPMFSRIKKIYYIADNDKTGKVAANRVAKSLGLDRTFIYTYTNEKEKYDSGDFFKEGGTAQDFKQIVESGAKTLPETGELNENRLRYRRGVVSLAR